MDGIDYRSSGVLCGSEQILECDDVPVESPGWRHVYRVGDVVQYERVDVVVPSANSTIQFFSILIELGILPFQYFKDGFCPRFQGRSEHSVSDLEGQLGLEKVPRPVV